MFFSADDLGRHLKNGELLLSPNAPPGTASRLLHTNFYSYAAQDTPLINHHWLSGVVFYLVFRLVGFANLNGFYILLGAITFLLSWRIAQKAAGWAVATAVALPLVPILAVRANVRPEVFSLLFEVIFLALLWKHYNGEVGWRALLVLPAIEILWVNFHIAFILGPVFVGAFMLGDLIERPPEGTDLGPNIWQSEFYREKFQKLRRWTGILLLTAGATLLNPNGVRGAIFPFTIWSNYGMDIAENHSFLYLENNNYTGEYTVLKLTLILLYLSFLAAILCAQRFPMPMLALGITVGALAFFAIRNQTLMAMFALPAISINLALCGLPEIIRKKRILLGTALGLVILAGAGFNGWKQYRRTDTIGLGLMDGLHRRRHIDFFRSAHLPGPILNNLNIGGYLIYHFYPQYKIYADSRPEAYLDSFLQSKYSEPLNDEARWQTLLAEYQFNVIYFSYAAKWERDFLARRVQDPDWAVVYAKAPVVIPCQKGHLRIARSFSNTRSQRKRCSSSPPKAPLACYHRAFCPNKIGGLLMSFRPKTLPVFFFRIPALAALLLAMMTCFTLAAQEVSSSITGRITDPAGLSIEGANITATDTLRATRWSAATNGDGFYAFPRIPGWHIRYSGRSQKDFEPHQIRTICSRSIREPASICRWNWAQSLTGSRLPERLRCCKLTRRKWAWSLLLLPRLIYR